MAAGRSNAGRVARYIGAVPDPVEFVPGHLLHRCETVGGLCSPLLRGAIAACLVLLCIEDRPAEHAREQLAALPDHDFVGEAAQWRGQQRFGEAQLAVEAGLIYAETPDERRRLQAEQQRIAADAQNWRYRLGEVGSGALTGEGDSLEALGGAVAADLFVFGDVRDLLIQGSRALRGEDADEVLITLSAAGLVLTAAPSLDLGAALLKFARRAGAMTARMASATVRLGRRALRRGDATDLRRLLDDTARLGRTVGAKPSLKILRHVDDPADLARASRFADDAAGGYVLWQASELSMNWLKTGSKSGARLLRRAGRKGPAGLDLLKRSGRLMLQPHPLLGLIKGIYRGNVPALAVELLRQHGAALMGVAAGWLALELGLLGVRVRRAWRGARLASGA